MVNGARQVPGARAMAVFKSVGAYVALDGLAIANAARPAAGAAGRGRGGRRPGALLDPGRRRQPPHARGRAHPGARALERPGGEGLRAPRLRALGAERPRGRRGRHDRAGRRRRRRGSRPQPHAGRRPARPGRPRHGGDPRGPRRSRCRRYSSSLEADILEPAPAAPARGRPRPPASTGSSPAGAARAASGSSPPGAAYPLLRYALAELGLDGEVPRAAPGPDLADRRRGRCAGWRDLVDEVVVMEERAGHLEDQVRRALEGRRQAVWGKCLPGRGARLPRGVGHGPRHRAGGPRRGW